MPVDKSGKKNALSDSDKVIRSIISPLHFDVSSKKLKPAAFPTDDFIDSDRRAFSVDCVTGLSNEEICQIVRNFADQKTVRTTKHHTAEFAYRARVGEIRSVKLVSSVDKKSKSAEKNSKTRDSSFNVIRNPLPENDIHCLVVVVGKLANRSDAREAADKIRNIFNADLVKC